MYVVQNLHVYFISAEVLPRAVLRSMTNTSPNAPLLRAWAVCSQTIKQMTAKYDNTDRRRRYSSRSTGSRSTFWPRCIKATVAVPHHNNTHLLTTLVLPIEICHLYHYTSKYHTSKYIRLFGSSNLYRRGRNKSEHGVTCIVQHGLQTAAICQPTAGMASTAEQVSGGIF